MKKEELVRAVLDRVAQAEREKEAELLRAGEKLLARILKLKPDLAQYEPKATTNGEVSASGAAQRAMASSSTRAWASRIAREVRACSDASSASARCLACA